jgi:hypothetical protein
MSRATACENEEGFVRIKYQRTAAVVAGGGSTGTRPSLVSMDKLLFEVLVRLVGSEAAARAKVKTWAKEESGRFSPGGASVSRMVQQRVYALMLTRLPARGG